MEQLKNSSTDLSNSRLWRAAKDTYSSPAEYEKHVIEQYKIAVEMADRISARRMLANSFFVAINTAIVAAIAFLAKEGYFPPSFLSIIPFFAIFLLCLLWWRIIISYKKLNASKFRIISEIEERLPLAVFNAEWLILGEGRDIKRYNPLTHIEQWVPWAFVLMYLGLSGIIMARI